jgi:iron complex transport system permease protein
MYRYQLLKLVLLGVVVSVSAMLTATLCGSDGCGVSDELLPLIHLRLPRVVSGFAVGGLLALAGALMQLLLRNPLADPYVLGVSGGSAAGALLFGIVISDSMLGLQGGALAGAFLATLVLVALARRSLSGFSAVDLGSGISLILNGVMVSAGFGALVTLLLSLANDTSLRGALFWLMGDLDTDSFNATAWLVLILALGWALRHVTALNVLVHGVGAAQLLGIPTARLQFGLLVVASVATAAAVAVAGAIGFIGLVVPHALRLLLGNDQRLLLPTSVFAGGTALVLADMAARIVLAPVQLPVGVATAMIGVPVFLYLLNRSRA